MSILERIATLTKAAMHEGLNRLENPVIMTGQYLRDLDDRIEEAEQQSRDLQAAAKLLERRLKEYAMLAELSEGDALKALERGDEEQAKQAIEAKLAYKENERECAAGLEETRQVLAGLGYEIAAAKEERVRLKAKRAELAERTERLHKAPDGPASTSIPAPRRTAFSGLNTHAAARGFERMEEKIQEWEARRDFPVRNVSPAVDTEGGRADARVKEQAAAELERLRGRMKSAGQKDSE
ncbi:PspA/IM30 family protein [Paenibacillus sp. 7124]|uniref:PspA/IM30 family protein n=1 Tax=Paenibacillus apii TaxID=1850370 RepID=A0A6M1PG71_9BACL|nr:PspA/IM30 family protein [Paenibacillus apii]NGM82489.1 PspA/IM30 family protein [Paenibacillus apii]NJJ39629.1 PspA/IM30 family protein [Paenibacillus apii]